MSANVETKSVRSEGSAGGLRRFIKVLAIAVLIGLALRVVWTSMVFVDESEYVIVERFGEIVAVYDRPEDRGLQFKLPWPIDVTRRFDRRVRLYEPPAREVFTADKKNITVAAYVSWRIAEPKESDSAALTDRPVVRYFRNFEVAEVAEDRLNSRIRSLLNTELGRLELSRLLSVTDSHAGPRDDERSLLTKIANDVRKRLETGKAHGSQPVGLTEELGIEIVDLRIQRLNFPAGNRQSVYDRMRSERKKEADRYRSEGIAANKAIRSRADLQYERVMSQAKADAVRIEGAAKARAIAIKNEAQAKDPEFYLALRKLETYKTILNERTTLVLSAGSNLLKMLTEGVPDSQPPKKAKSKSPAKIDGKKVQTTSKENGK